MAPIHRFLVLLAILLALPPVMRGQGVLPPASGPSYDSTWSGRWTGALLLDGRRWAVLNLDVMALSSGTIDVSFSLPDRNLVGQSASWVRRDGYDLSFGHVEDSVDATIRLDPATRRMSGTWRQRGRTFTIALRRGDLRDRPQEPADVIPYATRTLRIHHRAESVTLEGELVTPDATGRHPLALIISDHGEHDRDGLRSDGHRPHLVLADHLARHGWATFRWDDRGVGRSTGTLLVAGTAELATDITVILDRLRSEATIDTSRIVLIALGEGGLVGAAVAAQRPVDALILLGMPVVDGPTILRDLFDAEEAELGTPDSVRRVYRTMLTMWMHALRLGPDLRSATERIERIADSIYVATGRDLETFRALRRVVGPERHAYVVSAIVPWLQRYESLHPAASLRPIADRLHLFLGQRGRTVPAASNAMAFRELTGRDAVVVRDANMVLQPCDRCTLDETAELQMTIAPDVLGGIMEILRGIR